MGEKQIYHTIMSFFEPFLKNKEVRVFQFRWNGTLTAGTKKRAMRVSISIPKDIAHDNLKDLDKYRFYGIAIPKNEFDKLEVK